MDEREERDDERVFVVDAIDARPGAAGEVREACPDRAVPTDGIRHSASELAESVIRHYERVGGRSAPVS